MLIFRCISTGVSQCFLYTTEISKLRHDSNVVLRSNWMTVRYEAQGFHRVPIGPFFGFLVFLRELPKLLAPRTSVLWASPLIDTTIKIGGPAGEPPPGSSALTNRRMHMLQGHLPSTT